MKIYADLYNRGVVTAVQECCHLKAKGLTLVSKGWQGCTQFPSLPRLRKLHAEHSLQCSQHSIGMMALQFYR